MANCTRRKGRLPDDRGEHADESDREHRTDALRRPPREPGRSDEKWVKQNGAGE